MSQAPDRMDDQPDLSGPVRNPHGIMYEPGMDPERPWALTRPQPVASLLVTGTAMVLAKRWRPPPVICGKRLTIHAGSGCVALKRIDDAARDALEHDERLLAARGPMPSAEDEAEALKLDRLSQEGWRETLMRLPQGRIIGSARLVAAFQIGAVITEAGEGPFIYADRKEQAARHALGVWPDFDGWAGPMAGDFSPGRWVWCFQDAVSFAPALQAEMAGFGGVWDVNKGKALRTRQAERAAYHASVEQQEGQRA